MKVAVIGGGLAGISVARFLRELGDYHVTIFEKEDDLGGLVRTWRRPDGDMFDFGPHLFHSTNPFILDRVAGEISDLSYQVSPFARTFLGGRLYDYPVSIDNVLALPRDKAVDIIDELHKTDRSSLAAARTFEEYVIALVGPTLFDLFFRGYTEKLWGRRVSEIPSTWAPQRISFRKEDKRFFSDEWCVYFWGGIGELAGHFRSAARAREITGARIRRIERCSGWRIITNQGAEVFDAVISTIPVAQTLDYLECSDIAQMSFRSVIVMYLKILRPRALPADWIYFPESDYSFTRIFELGRLKPGSCAWEEQMGETGSETSSVTLEIPCFYNDDVWTADESELAALVREQLISSGLFSAGELGDWEFVRRRYCYPIHDMTSDEALKKNLALLEEYQGIIAAGRLGLFRYMNMDETIFRSWEIAEAASKVFNGSLSGSR